MAINYTPPGALTMPGQQGFAGSVTANVLEEYSGIVRGTLRRRSVLEGFIPIEHLEGSNALTNFGVGKTDLQQLIANQRPDPSQVAFGKRVLTVDVPILARNVVPLFQNFIVKYN